MFVYPLYLSLLVCSCISASICPNMDKYIEKIIPPKKMFLTLWISGPAVPPGTELQCQRQCGSQSSNAHWICFEIQFGEFTISALAGIEGDNPLNFRWSMKDKIKTMQIQRDIARVQSFQSGTCRRSGYFTSWQLSEGCGAKIWEICVMCTLFSRGWDMSDV